MFIIMTVLPIILSQTVHQLSGIIDVTLFNNVMGAIGKTDKEVKHFREYTAQSTDF